jgi:hypothetical protein
MHDMQALGKPPDDRLFRLIRENAPKQVEQAWKLLAPYYRMAAKRHCLFQPEEEPDKDAVAKAIQTAFSLETAPAIVLISVSNLPPKPDWMTEKVYWVSLRDSIKASIEVSLRDDLVLNLKDSLESSLRGGFEAAFRRSLGCITWRCTRDDLWNSLGSCLEPNLRESLWNSPDFSLEDSIKNSLFYYLGFVLARNEEMAKRLEGLVQVQAGCLILGIKRDEQDSWLVLCK